MNIQQIQATAESECASLIDDNYTRVYISAADYSLAGDVLTRFRQEIGSSCIKVKAITAGSAGYDDLEPTVLVEKPGNQAILYHNITPKKVAGLVSGCMVSGDLRPDFALCSTGDSKIDGIPSGRELPLFNLQLRIALRNCGCIDPEDINQYILRGNGYRGLHKALHMDRKAVTRELKESGLRGRGGAGFPTAEKWQICHDQPDSEKYVICNAIDAAPRARTSRLLLEGDPHSVLEGMLIAAYAVGASHCIIGVNADYTTAIKRLKIALQQMRRYSLLGDNILDTGFSCEVEIQGVPASFVSGEETALLRCLEQKQAMPYVRTVYPAVRGLNGKPTLVNNVETISHVAAIFQNSAGWYASTGRDRSKGTKIITLSGDIVHKYTIEIPFGTTLRRIIADIGGGVPGGKTLKAIQCGGPTGAFFAADSLDTPLDYDSIAEAGSVIGSGTLTVFDSDSCAVEMAKDAMAYLQAESCGKCVFCREGCYQAADILQDIAEFSGKPQDLELLAELGEGMKLGSICALGRTASNPLLSSLKLFHPDYQAHIEEKRCSGKHQD